MEHSAWMRLEQCRADEHPDCRAGQCAGDGRAESGDADVAADEGTGDAEHEHRVTLAWWQGGESESQVHVFLLPVGLVDTLVGWLRSRGRLVWGEPDRVGRGGTDDPSGHFRAHSLHNGRPPVPETLL